MKYMIYIPDKKLMKVEEHKHPGYKLLKLRRDFYRYLYYDMFRDNITLRAIEENGGLSKTKFIMSDSIPFERTKGTHFISYSGDIRAEHWFKRHPGRTIIPIVDDEDYNWVTEHRCDLDNAPDMYP